METFFANIGFMAVVILLLFIIKKINHYLYCNKTSYIGKTNIYCNDSDEDYW